MSKKVIVVVFEESNARVLVNPSNLAALQKQSNVVVDPDLREVKGIAPHFWKLASGKVIAMSEPERRARLRSTIRILPTLKNKYKSFIWKLLAALGWALVAAGLVIHFSKGYI